MCFSSTPFLLANDWADAPGHSSSSLTMVSLASVGGGSNEALSQVNPSSSQSSLDCSSRDGLPLDIMSLEVVLGEKVCSESLPIWLEEQLGASVAEHS